MWIFYRKLLMIGGTRHETCAPQSLHTAPVSQPVPAAGPCRPCRGRARLACGYLRGQELFPVRFYNEKGYDLIGLQVTDAVGHALDPSSREDGWTYLLAPGAYSYAYHDDRGIFFDLDETGFTVDGAAETFAQRSSAYTFIPAA